MRGPVVAAILVALVTTLLTADEIPGEKMAVSQSVQSYLKAREAEFDQIPAERKAELRKIATYVQTRAHANQPIKLTCICTHNSRRSQMSQIWAAAAARYYGIRGVETYSGGTEATAFNPRAVAAMQRAGILIEKTNSLVQGEFDANPRYAVRFVDGEPALICYSKVHHETPNPKSEFCAIMTCSQADNSCPVVSGCSLRVAITYDDPKASDNTSKEAATYDERCQQICREMSYLFSQVER
ncbi:low molecular weight phosphatase family protein [Schlesneria paludicola]|uniref:arsenate reductase n=1 Tax=Schlesneria paludicola TaxID=360056 RepID=UPI00029AD610|nr:arsenate reductase [Schlesneria paludicola]